MRPREGMEKEEEVYKNKERWVRRDGDNKRGSVRDREEGRHR